jgi:threonylcarbamoyladenosine tRNA methylthiotransferase MtaB
MWDRVSFYTLGCRLNQAETAILQKSLEREGFQVVPFNENAEVVVVNTCTVTQNGDADTRKVVNKINRKSPEAKIALIGCQAQIQREKLLELPNVQWVVGNAKKMDFADILKTRRNITNPEVITPVISRRSFTIPAAGIDRQHTRANLKIQDGCDFFCSFCVIPYARGRMRSREYGDIFREAKQLIEAGHREIVLTGINVGTYRYQDKSIMEVVEGLVNLPELDRLRISSIEPTTIPAELLQLMNRDSKLCRYLHIPLQSGSDEILHNMNRHYTLREFDEFINLVHDLVPGICLGTDVIVGFPGETDAHFEQTYQNLLNADLAYFHVFSYSERPWTKSRKLEAKVSPEIIEQRSRRLRELSDRKRRIYLQGQLGTIQTVLFEQIKKGYWTGLTDTYVRVKVKSNNNLQNRILPVQLESIEKNTIIGKLL